MKGFFMKRNIKSLWLFPFVSFLFILGISVLRALSVCTAYDAFIGYFESGSVVVLATSLLSAAYVILSLAVSIAVHYGEIPAIEDSGFSKSAAVALGVVILFFSINHTNISAPLDSMGICTYLSVVCLLLGLPLCLFAWVKAKNAKAWLSFGALAISLSFVLHALRHYLSTELPINGDLKILYMFTSLSAALFFLSEAKRMLIKANNDTSHRFFTLCCGMFCFSVGASECFAHLYHKEAVSEHISHALLLIFVGVYALSRTIPSFSLEEDMITHEPIPSPTLLPEIEEGDEETKVENSQENG